MNANRKKGAGPGGWRCARLLSCLLLGTLAGGTAGAVPVTLHTLLERSGGVGIPARLQVGDAAYDVPEDGLLLDLPVGRYPLRLLTDGGRLAGDGEDSAVLDVTGPATDRDVIVEPQTRLRLDVPAQVTLGEPFEARLTVTNGYGLPITLTPVLNAPDDLLTLGDTRRPLTLASGESGTLTVRMVAATGGTVNLTGTLNESSVQDARDVTVAQARPVTRTDHVLSGGLAELKTDDASVLPGEVTTFDLTLRNPGSTPLSVRATPVFPDWVTPDVESGEQTVTVPVGEEAHLSFSGTVAYGPAQDGRFRVQLSGLPDVTDVSGELRRELLDVQVAQPEDGSVGTLSSVGVLLRNPTHHALTFTLVGSGKGMTVSPVDLSVDAGGTVVGQLQVVPQQAGRLQFTVLPVTVLPSGEDVQIGLPVGSQLRATESGDERRVTTVRQPYALQDVPGLGEPGSNVTLLASLLLPEGVDYVGGSTLLDGQPLPDPRVGPDGRLFWPLGNARASGTLSFRVSHPDLLPTLPPLDLTARVGGRDLYLSGEVDSIRADDATVLTGQERQGLIRQPRQGTVLRGADKTGVVLEGPVGVPVTLSVNGVPVPDAQVGEETVTLGRRRLSFVGVPLRPGRNTLEARYGAQTDVLSVDVAGAPTALRIDAVGAVADGASPVTLRVLAVDANGVTSGNGTVTVNTDLEPLVPDADPREAGYQVTMRDGVAVLRLTPLVTARRVTVSAALGKLTARQSVFVDIQTRERYAYQGSFGVQFSGGDVSVDARLRGYAELPLWGGQLQVAADSDGLRDAVTTASSQGRFPSTGSATEAQGTLSSDFGVAFRFERRNLSAGYYAAPLTLAPLPPLPNFSALRAEVRDLGVAGLTVQGYVGQLPGSAVTETFVPDGRRSFVLESLPQPGSELVTVMSGGISRTLLAGREYTLDTATGTLVLARALSRYDSQFLQQTLVVVYAPASQGARVLSYGVGASYARGPWTVSAAALNVGAGTLAGSRDVPVSYGVQVAYRTPELQAALNYGVSSFDPDGKFALNGTYVSPDARVTASANLTRAPGTGVVGQAEATVRLDAFRVRVAHLSLNVAPASETQPQPVNAQRSTVTVERPVGGGVTLGAGLEYAWARPDGVQGGLAGVLLARYERGGSSLEVTHAQPFGANVAALTRVTGSLALTSSTFLEARLARVWDETGTLIGELGVRQTLGSVNFSVIYQLPNASGESSRARFGVSAPIPITDHLSANVSASVLRALGNGVFTASGTVALRYRQAGFAATGSMEVGRDFGAQDGSTANRLILRGGASGSLNDNDVSFDAVYNVMPSPGGQFTFGLARRTSDLTLLTYHRLNTGSGALGVAAAGIGTVLEGEAQLSWQPWLQSEQPVLHGLQLQPGLAYRVPLSDPSRFAVQGSAGVSVPLSEKFALAATLFALYQPAQDAPLDLSYALDLKYVVSPGLRFVAGYTLAHVDALTPDARPGFHVRAELYGGTP